jgi:4-aminobutyrate aminotransferase-like enzyme
VPREELLERVSNVGAVMQYELEVLCAEYPGLIANARSLVNFHFSLSP